MELIKSIYTYFCNFYTDRNEVVKAGLLLVVGYIAGTVLG